MNVILVSILLPLDVGGEEERGGDLKWEGTGRGGDRKGVDRKGVDWTIGINITLVFKFF